MLSLALKKFEWSNSFLIRFPPPDKSQQTNVTLSKRIYALETK